MRARSIKRAASAVHEGSMAVSLMHERDNLGVATSIEVDLMPVARIYGGGLYVGALPG